jgi:hypothetical protein
MKKRTSYFWPLFALSLLLSLVGTAVAIFWQWWRRAGLFPAAEETLTVHNVPSAPTLAAGQTVKVMTYNVQYFAGTEQFFFYEGGQDVRPTRPQLVHNYAKIAGIIAAEQPDVVLLQEVNLGDSRTYGDDQLAGLRAHLPPEYACWAQTFYWRVGFVPHPHVWGAAGMTLVILSKYRLDTAVRFALPPLPRPWYLR